VAVYKNAMRLRLIACLGMLAASVSTAPAAAQPILDRVQVGVPGDAATRGYDDALSVALEAPAEFGRGCCYDGESGEWLGPRYAASANPSIGNPSRIAWDVSFARVRGSARALAASAGWADLPELDSGSKRVDHIVGGRRAGRLKARYALDAARAPGARVQAALVIELARRLHGLIVFDLSDPPADDAGSLGSFTVGGMPASAWNVAKARTALDRVYVEGNLPPARVRARKSGRRVRGAVSDVLGHPVSEVNVTLQRRSGGSWRTAATGSTTTRGRFTLRAARPGSYRVVATFGGTTAKSARIG
jgi:Carboxypeptidase regulatory-like domain